MQVIGFAHFGYEVDALYLNREAYEQAVVTNSIRLHVPDRHEVRALTGRYLIVAGVFHANETVGPATLRVGSISDVSRLDPWPGPGRAEYDSQAKRGQ